MVHPPCLFLLSASFRTNEDFFTPAFESQGFFADDLFVQFEFDCWLVLVGENHKELWDEIERFA